MTPETHFAQNGSVSIAYQVFGDGPRDLIVIPGWLSNLDIFWEEPMAARFFLALSRFSRVILIDRRGTGLSDRVAPPTLEEQIDDFDGDDAGFNRRVRRRTDDARASAVRFRHAGISTLCPCSARDPGTLPTRRRALVALQDDSVVLPTSSLG